MAIIRSWRIQKKFFSTAFNGEGAKKKGGRWNSIGTPMVYTAGSLSLATLEMLAHLPSYDLLKTYKCIEAQFDDRLLKKTDHALPVGWDSDIPGPASKNVGDQWISLGESLILQVPSSIVQQENNYLINPDHPDFHKIVIGSPINYPYDKRLES